MKITPGTANGKPTFILDARDYKKGRQYFTSKADAVTEMERLKKLGKDNANAINALPQNQGIELSDILTECKALGVTLRQMADYWKTTHLNGAPKTVRVVWQEMLVFKRQIKKRRESTLHTLGKGPLMQFCAMYGDMLITQVQRVHVETFLASRELSAGGRNTALARISGLFGHAKRQEYIAKNPCKLIELGDEEEKEPFVLTNVQVRRILDYTLANEPDKLAYLTLALFCGLRPTEARQMLWDCPNLQRDDPRIDQADWSIKVTAKITKVSCRRLFTPRPSAVAWLQAARRLGGRLVLPEMTRLKYQKRLAKLLGLKNPKTDGFAWPLDAFRHTCATHWCAVESMGDVADYLGTSKEMLQKHYKALLKEKTATEFWDILPAGDAKTIAFPAAREA